MACGLAQKACIIPITKLPWDKSVLGVIYQYLMQINVLGEARKAQKGKPTHFEAKGTSHLLHHAMDSKI